MSHSFVFYKSPEDSFRIRSLPPTYDLFQDFLRANKVNLKAYPIITATEDNGTIYPVNSEPQYSILLSDVKEATEVLNFIFSQQLEMKLYITPTKKSGAIPLTSVDGTQCIVKYSTRNGFDETFKKSCEEQLLTYCLTVYPEINKNKRVHPLDPSIFRLNLYQPVTDNTILFTEESFRQYRIQNLIFSKLLSYSEIQFGSLTAAKLVKPMFNLDRLSFPFKYYNKDDKRLDYLFDKYNMKQIERYISLYLSLFQFSVDLDSDRWSSEANRRIIINIFIILVSCISNKNFSVESVIEGKNEYRIGNGPLDCLFLPSYIRTNLLPLFTDKSFNLGQLFTCTEEEYLNLIGKYVVGEASRASTSSSATTKGEAEAMKAPDSSKEKSECTEMDSSPTVFVDVDNLKQADEEQENHEDEEERKEKYIPESDITLLESKLTLQNLDKSLGQLAAQMHDCLNWTETTPTSDSTRKKGSFVKGILSTGQTCLFFGMSNVDADGQLCDPPRMFYYGYSRLNVLPVRNKSKSAPRESSDGRGSGLDSRPLTINREDVDMYFKQLFVFLTHPLDLKEYNKHSLESKENNNIAELPEKKRKSSEK